MRSRALVLTVALPAALALSACSSGDGGDTAASGGPVTVAATDTPCAVSRAEADAGTIEFEITNTGSKVNEFYVYADGAGGWGTQLFA